MQLVSTITCPACGHRASETMPTDACMFLLCVQVLRDTPQAQGKGLLRILLLRGRPCPPIQEARANGEKSGCCK